VTVLEVIQRSTEFLAKKGVDSARLQAELLLANVLKLPRMQLYLKFERTLATAELDAFREMVRRRGQREPLQHIIGSTSFCGLEIEVNRDVLVPRPETELLAEFGWTFLNQIAFRSAPRETNSGEQLAQMEEPLTLNFPPATALDFGTGSGCLAIALAVRSPIAQIYALDISPEALKTATRNADRLGVSERIHFVLGDGLAALPAQARVHLIVANPPYVPTAEIVTLQPEVRDHDPHGALDGGPDGLDFIRRLALDAAPFLISGGKLMLEFGDSQAEPVRKLFEEQNWIVEQIAEDYTHRPRILIARYG
jgi:release factor glutamine methyltransferase